MPLLTAPPICLNPALAELVRLSRQPLPVPVLKHLAIPRGPAYQCRNLATSKDMFLWHPTSGTPDEMAPFLHAYAASRRTVIEASSTIHADLFYWPQEQTLGVRTSRYPQRRAFVPRQLQEWYARHWWVRRVLRPREVVFMS